MDKFDSLESIKKSIEIQKEKIQTTDVSIKKMTGRSPGDDRYLSIENSYPASLKRPLDNCPPVVYSRLDPNYPNQRNIRTIPKDRSDEDFKSMLPSSIVQVGEKRSRTDALKELKSSDRDRGRRMFNILQSTLTQFKVESKAATDLPIMERRRKLESRIEEKATKEKESLRLERQDLFRKRREQQLELSLLNQKSRMINGFEAWKEEALKMVDFIRTTHSPHIFYRPRLENNVSEDRKKATKESILETIKKRRTKLESDYQEMATSRRRRLGLPPVSSTTDISSEFSSEIHTTRNPSSTTTSLKTITVAEEGICDDDFALEDDEDGDGEWKGLLDNGHLASHVISKVFDPAKEMPTETPLSDFDADEPVVMLEEQAAVEQHNDRRRVLLASE